MTIGTILITSFAIAAIHYMIAWEGMVLFPLKKYLERLPVIIRKPLYECLFCMSSIWGITILYFIHKLPIDLHFIYYLFAIAGVNFLIEITVTAISKLIIYFMTQEDE